MRESFPALHLMSPFTEEGRDDKHLRERNEKILAGLKEGRHAVDLAKEHGLSQGRIYQMVKEVKERKEREKNWGQLSVRLVTVLKKRFGFRCLQDLMASPITKEDFMMTKGVGFKAYREVKDVTGKF